MRKSDNKKFNQSGFTLIELLVVIVIIGILAGIAIPVFLNQRKKATVSGMRSDIATVRTAFAAYNLEKNTFGTEEVIAAGGVATGPALIDFGFKPTPGNTLTTLHDDVSRSLCVVVANAASDTVAIYATGPGSVASSCTSGYPNANSDVVDSVAVATLNVTIISRGLRPNSPVCTSTANAAKQNMGCPVGP